MTSETLQVPAAEPPKLDKRQVVEEPTLDATTIEPKPSCIVITPMFSKDPSDFLRSRRTLPQSSPPSGVSKAKFLMEKEAVASERPNST